MLEQPVPALQAGWLQLSLVLPEPVEVRSLRPAGSLLARVSALALFPEQAAVRLLVRSLPLLSASVRCLADRSTPLSQMRDREDLRIPLRVSVPSRDAQSRVPALSDK